MAKFVLIDHSIRDLVGHHYEYADHVLKAAARAGYQPFLATNRSFRASPASEWQVFPVYEFGFWAKDHETRSSGFFRSKAAQATQVWFVCKCRLRFSHLGLAWLGRTTWGQYLSRKPSSLLGWGWHLLGAWVIAALKVGRLAILILLLPLVVLTIPFLACWRLLTRVKATDRYLRTFGHELRTYRDFSRAVTNGAWDAVRRCSDRARASFENPTRAFARDTATLFGRVRLVAGDVVFFPTISDRDALGLLDFFQSAQPDSRVTWHLLFRRNLYGGRPGADAPHSTEAARMQQTLQRFKTGARSQKLYFYTDSDELTVQYNLLGTFRFTTLPIPHTHPGRESVAGVGPLEVAYLGDARKEKGFHLLPGIVGDLTKDYLRPAKIKFAVQANYNVAGGEPEAAIARAQLESLPIPGVTLYREALPPEEYRSLLLSADIILLPYDPVNYYSRSSGILVEALAAGIPVVVPAGTWLSRQLQAGGAGRYLSTLRNNMDVLQSWRQSSLSWYFHGTSEVRATMGEKLEVSLERKAYCWLDVPQGATHLLVNARFNRWPHEGRLNITQMNDDPLGAAKSFFLQGDQHGNWGVVLRLQPAARRLWFALGGNVESEFISIEQLEIDFLSAPPTKAVPIGAAGLAYHDVGEIPALIREMVDHYEHYRRTATQFALQWRRFHNADRLIVEIRRNTGDPQPPEPVRAESALPAKALV